MKADDPILFFVVSTSGSDIELVAVGDKSLGTIFRSVAPNDMIGGLVGRHCWVSGGMCGPTKIERWEPLPKFEIQQTQARRT